MKGDLEKWLIGLLYVVVLGGLFYILIPKYEFIGIQQIAGVMRCNKMSGQVDFAFPGAVGGANYPGWKTISSTYQDVPFNAIAPGMEPSPTPPGAGEKMTPQKPMPAPKAPPAPAPAPKKK